ncbi:hypothetical protein A8144_13095 [Mycobacterium leprae 3125609]|nr:hypothetical protein A8144_13095 [Mycobacterium leprae 3125609]
MPAVRNRDGSSADMALFIPLIMTAYTAMPKRQHEQQERQIHRTHDLGRRHVSTVETAKRQHRSAGQYTSVTRPRPP